MKTVFIGDIHGRNIWKEIVKKEKKADRIIFVGDYVDSFDISREDQYNNLKDLFEYAYKNNKVELLIGNHDLPYMANNYYEYYRCSGVTREFYKKCHHLYEEYSHLFKCSTFVEDTLITHAGVTDFILKLMDINSKDVVQISEKLNNLFTSTFDKENPIRNPLYYVSSYSGGYDPVSGPFWTRPQEFKKHGSSISQIYGHTATDNININELINIDTFDTTNKYLIKEDGIYEVRSV